MLVFDLPWFVSATFARWRLNQLPQFDNISAGNDYDWVWVTQIPIGIPLLTIPLLDWPPSVLLTFPSPLP